jgi:pyruvate dehydrogenase E2 component (dihydrolipoamide acetyltransferase)
MAFEFKLPDIGEGVVEGELTKWLVDEGQAVVEDTPLFEVLTDKVSAVIPSPRKGTVTKRHFAEGDMVPVGAIVVTIEESGAAAAAPAPAAAAPTAPAPAAAAAPAGVAAPAAAAPAPAPAAPAPVSDAAAPAPAPEAAAPAREPGERVRAAPATRKLARDLGVDLQAVAGSGDTGRVTKADIESFAQKIVAAPAGVAVAAGAKAAPAPTAIAKGADDERVKLKGLRRKIYAKMRESKDHVAHFTYVDEIDFTAIIAIQDALAQSGLKSTFLPFVVKAVVLSLQKPEFAYLNAQIDEAAGEIVIKKRYHIGVAAATDAGLVVPVVRDCNGKSIRQLIDAIRHLGEGARDGKLTAEEMSGSTFTITSLGKLGGMFATPIVNYPESAILGLHKVEKRPAVVDGQIVIRDRMYMSCSFDHRLIDGHVGAAFVQSVKTYLEQPALMLAELV